MTTDDVRIYCQAAALLVTAQGLVADNDIAKHNGNTLPFSSADFDIIALELNDLSRELN